jgi:hypothetical protein
MTAALAKNRKISKSGKNTFNFGIPKHYSQRFKMVTCTQAKDCLGGCYAGQKTFTWPKVQNAYENRLEMSLSDHFPAIVVGEIRAKKAERIRIHDSGDFYSREYLHKWFSIMEQCPDVEFYCYTKEVSMMKAEESLWPENLTVVYSYGGKEDYLIDDENDRHSKVFQDWNALDLAGYADASDQDDVALGDSLKIGLVYHGAAAKNWGMA